MSYAIEVISLTKRYIKQKSILDSIFHPFKNEIITAIEDISFHINKGELFGLLVMRQVY